MKVPVLHLACYLLLFFVKAVFAGDLQYIDPMQQIAREIFKQDFVVKQHGFGVASPKEFDSPSEGGYAIRYVQSEPFAELGMSRFHETARINAGFREALPKFPELASLEAYVLAGYFVDHKVRFYVVAFAIDAVPTTAKGERIIVFLPALVTDNEEEALREANDLAAIGSQEGPDGDGVFTQLAQCECAGERIPLDLIPVSIALQSWSDRANCRNGCSKQFTAALIATGIVTVGVILVGVATGGYAGLVISLVGAGVPWVAIPAAIYEYRTCKRRCEKTFCRGTVDAAIQYHDSQGNPEAAEALRNYRSRCPDVIGPVGMGACINPAILFYKGLS